MHKIKVIGAGQLGSRHLQALKGVEQPLTIEVVDPNEASLQVAKERYDAIDVKDCPHQINYASCLSPDEQVDIAIVASTASTRRKIIEELLSVSEVRHLVLEKLLFTQFEDYEAVGQLLSQSKTKAWTNCCMRTMPFYQQLKSEFLGRTMTYLVQGSQFGLVTNAIHYLDHVAYLTGCNTFEVDTFYLDKTIIESKRPGYLELTGTLMAKFDNGSIAQLQCLASGELPVQIEMSHQDYRIISREWEQKAWESSLANQWQWQELEARIPYQSEMTKYLVTDLLQTEQCGLTDYETSKQLHLQLLEPLRGYIAEQGQQNDTIHYPFT